MNLDIKKPTWVKIYYGISLILIIFAVVEEFKDTSGFGILVAGPIAILGILLAGLALGVYYSKKIGKTLIINIILWLFFLVAIGYLLFSIVNTISYYSVSGLSGWPITLFFLLASALLLGLLIILNRK